MTRYVASEKRMSRARDLERFFYPETIAVIGATPNSNKPGFSLMKNLAGMFRGVTVPVNPRYDAVMGLTCYPSVEEIPLAVDLAVVFVPARAVPDAIRGCVSKGISSIIVESAGFAETGSAGRALQQEVRAIADAHNIRVWGPNCTGLVNSENMLLTPFIYMPELDEKLRGGQGNCAIVAQSGMMAAGFMSQVIMSGYFRVSKACAIGNKVDVDEADILHYLAMDRATEVILMYLESLSSGRDFLAAIEHAMDNKPVVILKSGRTESGKAAVTSHTASLAGNDAVISGIMKQQGIMAADDFIQMVRIGKAFSLRPQPFRPVTASGRNVAVITVTGGGGVVACDLLDKHGLEPAQLSDTTLLALKQVFPAWMEPCNPVDVWPAIELHGGRNTFLACLEAILPDPNVDGILLMPYIAPRDFEFAFDAIGALFETHKKPVVSWIFGDPRRFPAFSDAMEGIGICVFDELIHCVEALEAYLSYGRYRHRESPRKSA